MILSKVTSSILIVQPYKHKEKLQKTLLKWAKEHPVYFPWRKRISRFHALIVEILLQRTKAEQVVPVFYDFKNVFPTAKELATSRITTIRRVIHPLGLLWRAKYLKLLGEEIINSGGRITDEYKSLLSMSGVGPYVASSYLSLHRGIKKSIVDSNIVRLYCRLINYSYDGETRRKSWLINFADSLTPTDKFRQYNYALLDFTRAICKIKPDCIKCPLKQICLYYLERRKIS